MKVEDSGFRKKCQEQKHKITKLLKQGKNKEARYIIKQLEETLCQWHEYERSVRSKINMLKSLFAQVAVEETRFNRRQQKNGG
jgi:hypothetical protein